MLRRYARQRVGNARERGTAYVLVLGITTMLVIIGIGSIMLSRVTLEQNRLEEDVITSRLAATSALDVMHKRIDGETNWRSLVSNNAWSGGETHGQAQIQFKFVDEDDANLADDTAEPFRLYARASVGHAVRVYSVELKPDDSNRYNRDAKTFRRESND